MRDLPRPVTETGVTRRSVVGCLAGGMVGCAPLIAAGKRKEGPPPMIDTHQHLWDITKLNLPWIRKSPLPECLWPQSRGLRQRLARLPAWSDV